MYEEFRVHSTASAYVYLPLNYRLIKVHRRLGKGKGKSLTHGNRALLAINAFASANEIPGFRTAHKVCMSEQVKCRFISSKHLICFFSF